MATTNVTAEPKSYLGHPCSLAAAMATFAEPLAESKETADTRWLAQKIGATLHSVYERAEHVHDALELADGMADTAGDMQLAALLAMSKAYMRDTCDEVFDLCGQVLDALQRADMVKPSQQAEGGAA